MAIAINGKNIPVIELLLEAGADINIIDDEDYTTLHRAVENRDLDKVKLLLEYGADPNFYTYLFSYGENFDIVATPTTLLTNHCYPL